MRFQEICKGKTYREAAQDIMKSLNDVQKKLGMTILVEPVLENATKAVTAELNRISKKKNANIPKEIQAFYDNADPVDIYSRFVVEKVKKNEEKKGKK